MRARLALWRPPVAPLLIGLAAWVGLASLLSDGHPLPIVLVAVAAATSFTGARLVPRPLEQAVPLAIALAGAAVMILDGDGTFSGDPSAGLFGYANAKGQFFALAGFAVLVLGARQTSVVARALGIATVGAFAAVPIASRSLSASGLLAGLGLLAVLPRSAGQRRVAAGGMLVAFVAVLATTIALGAVYPRGLEGERLGHHRAGLWHDGLVLTGRHPLTGVGGGRFALESPSARRDPPPGHAHHIYLQLSAETGVLGGLLLVLAVISALAFAAWQPNLDRVGILGAAVVTSIAIHASLDDVLHQLVLALMAAALAGSALPRSVRRSSA